MRTIYINGKFLAQRVTGVQRVARALVRSLDDQLPDDPGRSRARWVLLCPPRADVPALRHIEIRRVGHARMSLVLWEQAVLPFASRDGTLLSLSGSAPVLKRGQVCTIHDAAVFDHPEAYRPLFVAWYRLLFRRLARSARLVLTVSDFSRSRLATHLRLDDRIAVVRNGAEHMAAVAAESGILGRLGLAGRRFLLAVGSSNPTKNHATLLRAFRDVPDPQARLVVVGGAHRGVFTAAPFETADPRVLHVGPVSDGELKALYEHAAGLVFPSIYEGFGLPPLEAMFFGCPVAASHTAAIPEVCEKAALYFDPLRVEHISAAMQRLLDDAALGAQLKRSGLQRARELTWAAAASSLLSHLRSAGLVESARS